MSQWIRVGEPIEELRLALPDVPGTGLSVDRVVVVAEGRVNGPARISARGTTYTFSPTKVVQVSYRMRGAVTRSNDDGRALVVATNLDVTYSVQSERETRVVRAAEVLTLACARTATTAPVPCGTADDREQWRVELQASRARDHVVGRGSAPCAHSSSRPCSMAHRVSWTRLFIWSLRSVFWTWFCTVRCESTSRAAICL